MKVTKRDVKFGILSGVTITVGTIGLGWLAQVSLLAGLGGILALVSAITLISFEWWIVK